MIDLKQLRQEPERFKQGAVNKNYDAKLIDELLAVDADLRKLTAEREQLTAEKNKIGKQIGSIAGQMKRADDAQKAELQAQMKALQARPHQIKAREAELNETIAELEPQRDAIWLQIPQPADADVPVGKDADDNIELSTWAPADWDHAQTFETNRGFKPKTHLELGEQHDLFDFERGAKISGARSYVLKGDGFRLHNAVLRYAFDFMTNENGFTPLTAACMVRHQTMVGTGFFPGGRDQVYDIKNPTSEEGLALTGTGEVGLMAYHADEILEPQALPLTYTTVSTCFRREAGAAGRDSAGLYRIHQFDKVEQVVICKADEQESRAWHQKMLGFVQKLLKRLELPHRLLQCCTGDLGTKNADMIDVECWMPSRGELGTDGNPKGAYGETHSASRLYDYQTRRLNIRYRDPDTKKTVIAHSLNNTVAASPRILIPILEMHQQEDGRIKIPSVLRPYMGGQEYIGA